MEHIAHWQSPPDSFLKFVMVGSHLFHLLSCCVQTAHQVSSSVFYWNFDTQTGCEYRSAATGLLGLQVWIPLGGHRCLSFVSVGFCQVMGQSLSQRSPAKCVCVIEHDQVQKQPSMHILYSRQRPEYERKSGWEIRAAGRVVCDLPPIAL